MLAYVIICLYNLVNNFEDRVFYEEINLSSDPDFQTTAVDYSSMNLVLFVYLKAFDEDHRRI